jgi:predicted RNA binding protein YcfA (HicA-like mRNA interferase family)
LPKIPRLTAEEAEKRLFKAGFRLVRTKGSHRIYQEGKRKIYFAFSSRQNIASKNNKGTF